MCVYTQCESQQLAVTLCVCSTSVWCHQFCWIIHVLNNDSSRFSSHSAVNRVDAWWRSGSDIWFYIWCRHPVTDHQCCIAGVQSAHNRHSQHRSASRLSVCTITVIFCSCSWFWPSYFISCDCYVVGHRLFLWCSIINQYWTTWITGHRHSAFVVQWSQARSVVICSVCCHHFYHYRHSSFVIVDICIFIGTHHLWTYAYAYMMLLFISVTYFHFSVYIFVDCSASQIPNVFQLIVD